MIRTITRRIACLLLAAWALLWEMPLSTPAATASGYQDWSGSSTWLRGDGSAESPFLLSTPRDLAYFRDQVAAPGGYIQCFPGDDPSAPAEYRAANSAHYRLTADILFNDPNGAEWESWSETVAPTNGGGTVHRWTPPGMNGDKGGMFQGHLDGSGHTIYGLYIVQPEDRCVGFLGLMSMGTVENLHLSSGCVIGGNCTAAFVGRAVKCLSLVGCATDLHVSGGQAVGGFVGGNPHSAKNPEAATLPEKETTKPNFALYGCTNTGSITGQKWVGGMAGLITAGSARVSIDSCENTGTVTSSGPAAGGILGGTNEADGLGHSNIFSCTNTGAVTGGGYAGGIVGCGRAIDLFSCTNRGPVTGKNNTGGVSGGSSTPDPLTNSVVLRCVNTGPVTGKEGVGGVIGSAVSTDVRECANLSAVTGEEEVGGVAGRAGRDTDLRPVELSDCLNTGTVSASGDLLAGIVGHAADGPFPVALCRCVSAGAAGGHALSCWDETGPDAQDCFAIRELFSDFAGCTGAASLCTRPVLEALNDTGAWRAGYPVPVPAGLDPELQGDPETSGIFSAPASAAVEGPALELRASFPEGEDLLQALAPYGPVFGFLVLPKADLPVDAQLLDDTPGGTFVPAEREGAAVTGRLAGLGEDQYEDVYLFRPVLRLTVEDLPVTLYGPCGETSLFTAEGAGAIPALAGAVVTACEEEIYLLEGGTHSLEFSAASAGPVYSVAMVSSDETVAAVSEGVVTGRHAGTAQVTVKILGPWGTKTHRCTVHVLEDLDRPVTANDYAARDGELRYRLNSLAYLKTTLDKNDGHCVSCDGEVFLIDGGHANDESLRWLLRLRELYLAQGYESGRLSEEDYHRCLLSDRCRLQFTSLLTHWHDDHLGALRYVISREPKVQIGRLVAAEDPAGKTAASYDSYVDWFRQTLARAKINSPDLELVRVGFGEELTTRFGSGGVLTVCGPYDFSTVPAVTGEGVPWQNDSSVWYVFDYAGKKLLFTGDTYPNDVGMEFSNGTLSGRTAVDYMLQTHADAVGENVFLLECNHHGRRAFVENLFDAVRPAVVVSGLRYGMEDALTVSKAVETADFYLAGDGEAIFAFRPDGSFAVEKGAPAYSRNEEGKAVRNYVTRRNQDFPLATVPSAEPAAPAELRLSAAVLTLAPGERAPLTAVVLPGGAAKLISWSVSDPAVLSFDGDAVTGLAPGTATITLRAGEASASCTVTVTPAFTDVPAGAYYTKAVAWAVANGITTGTTPAAFEPTGVCTRAQVVTFLWRAAGRPEPGTAECPFTDVKPTAYYYKAVLWAVEQGITTGTTVSTFGPTGACTRAQVVTFLWRAAGSPEPTAVGNPFTDVKPADYFCKAVLWAVENGVTTGIGEGAFSPGIACLREHVVTFLWRAAGEPE